MKFSRKSPPPVDLQNWLALANEDWQPTYAALAGVPKESTHNSLLLEQGFVCCYCGGSLNEDRSDSHIEHFWPQSIFNGKTRKGKTYPDLTLDYDNLFASCGPPRPDQVPITCGAAKGSWFDPVDHVIPSDESCEQRFRYGGGGEILPAVAGDNGGANMIRVLKLEQADLTYERSQIISGVEDAILRGEITAASKPAEIAMWRSRDAGQRLKGFGHVAARYLEDEPLM